MIRDVVFERCRTKTEPKRFDHSFATLLGEDNPSRSAGAVAFAFSSKAPRQHLTHRLDFTVPVVVERHLISHTKITSPLTNKVCHLAPSYTCFSFS